MHAGISNAIVDILDALLHLWSRKQKHHTVSSYQSLKQIKLGIWITGKRSTWQTNNKETGQLLEQY